MLRWSTLGADQTKRFRAELAPERASRPPALCNPTRRRCGLVTTQPGRSHAHRELVVVDAHEALISAVVMPLIRGPRRRLATEASTADGRETRFRCSRAEPDFVRDTVVA